MTTAAPRDERPRTPRLRWECGCSDPPVLLARYEPGGVTEIKVRDRWYWVEPGGTLRTICPKCGQEHTLTDEQGKDAAA